MDSNRVLKSRLLKSLSNFTQDDDKKEQLVNELDVLSNLIINFYLEQSTNSQIKDTVEQSNLTIDNNGNYQ